MSPQNRILLTQQIPRFAIDFISFFPPQKLLGEAFEYEIRHNGHSVFEADKLGLRPGHSVCISFAPHSGTEKLIGRRRLVAAGFDVLRTSRNISILLAAIQVLTVLLLGFILVALVGLLITVSPDLEEERRTLVTPAVKWLALWVSDRHWLRALIWTLLVGSLIGGSAGWYLTRDVRLVEQDGDENEEADKKDEDAETGSG